MVGAVQADVEIGTTARALVAKAHPLPRGEVDLPSAGMAAHGPDPAERPRPRQARELAPHGDEGARIPSGDPPFRRRWRWAPVLPHRFRSRRRTQRVRSPPVTTRSRPGAAAGGAPPSRPAGRGEARRAHRTQARSAFGWGLLALLLAAPPAAAQSGPQPDLTDLALAWARGEYRAPLVCTLGGEPRRGLRRILITPESSARGRRADRIRFFDLQAEGASRCVNALGEPEPNLEGLLRITLQTPSRPDVATRDFKDALRRDRGFEFAILSGALRITPVGGQEAAGRTVDFSGGTARLVGIRAGTDAARILADFRSPRKLELTLRARSGEEVRLRLFQTGLR